MADISSVSSSSSSTSQTQIDALLSSYRATEQPKIDTLNTQKYSLQRTQVFYNNLNSKLNSLVSNLDKFGTYSVTNNIGLFTKLSTIDSQFAAKTVTSSNTNIMTATATSGAFTGTASIMVNRLATSDVLISKQMALTDNFGISAGDKTFGIDINGTVKNVTVSFDGTETNDQALQKITTAINNTEDIGINATVVKDTTSTARLSLSSKSTGGTNNIKFTDSEGVLGLLGIDSSLGAGSTARTLATDNSAGFIQADFNTLDAKLTVNGVNVYRASNAISDVITGLTLNLVKPQESTDQPVVLTTQVNTAAVKDLINTVLSSLNDITNLISSDTSILRSESTISLLRSNIRSLVSTKVASITDEKSPKYLTDLGITVNDSGNFVLSDTKKLEAYLKDNPQKVADLFTTSDGIISKVNGMINNLQGSNGLISSRRDSLNHQITRYDKRITDTQAKIDAQTEAMRKQYTTLLDSYYTAQSQFSMMSSFLGSTSTSIYGY
jgi:flagellar hook-associated protein 2